MARNRKVVSEGFVGGERGMLEDQCNCRDLEKWLGPLMLA